MSNQKIIIFIITLFVLSAGYLFYFDQQNIDPNYRKSWWALSFQDPKSSALDFTIENHSNKNNFRWEVLRGTEKISEGTATLKKGEQKNIALDVAPIAGEKIVVSVFDGTDKKEIYKFIR